MVDSNRNTHSLTSSTTQWIIARHGLGGPSFAAITATGNAAKALMDVSEFTSPVDYGLFLRTNIYIPDNESNPRRAWDIAQVGVRCQFDPDVVKDFIPQVDATIVLRILENAGTIHGKATCESMTHGAASFTSPNGAMQNPYANTSWEVIKEIIFES
ncbi:hypothetical protein IW262DRAFT_1467525 [Armillaria fumosa]|nr:hypothetical protein IW262DRAFT_1467525 [Armillaria fumosa]